MLTYRFATTILTALTVFLHTAVGCGACRLCESSSPAASSNLTARMPSPCLGTCAGHRHVHDDRRSPDTSSTSAHLVVDVAGSSRCECSGEQHHCPSHPCGHSICSLRVAKFLNSTGTVPPDMKVVWSTPDELRKSVVDGRRSYPARRFGHHPSLRSHLALNVLLI